jgi:DNA-directed RNA polymerase subunit E'/Rpb7
MEHIATFEEQVALTPRDMRAEIKSIDAILEQKLRARLETRCSRHGYVLPDSVKILSRSMGMVEKGRFTGNILYHVQAEAGVLNPPDGVQVDGEVIRKNKMGLYVNYRDAIRIIVPRDVNLGNDEFESVEVGEVIRVEIKKSRFQVNDEYILSVGLFKGLAKGVAERRKAKALEEGEAAVATEVAKKVEEEEEEEAEAAEEEEAEAVEEADEEDDAAEVEAEYAAEEALEA